jgi:hypothetical protein
MQKSTNSRMMHQLVFHTQQIISALAHHIRVMGGCVIWVRWEPH